MGVDLAISYRSGGTDVPVIERCIGAVLDSSAASLADHPALIVRQQNIRYTYGELRAEVERVARGLLVLGVQKGDRVGIWATNFAEWVLAQFAAAKIGAILVNINPNYRASELERALRHSECQTLLLIRGFRDCDYVSTLSSIAPEIATCRPGLLQSEKLPHLKNLVFIGGPPPAGMWGWNDLLTMSGSSSEGSLREREAQLRPHDPISIQYTSGTTGAPMGAVLSHFNLVNNARMLAATMKLTPQDRLCIPVPFYHCFGMVAGNLCCVASGATIVVPAESFDPLATLQALEAERCTTVYGVPTMFIAELEHLQFSRFDLRSLRTGIIAGSLCPRVLVQRIIEEMHCREMTIAYGMTECSPAVTQTLTDGDLELRVSTVGQPLPHTVVKIADLRSGETLPCGTQGELCVRGYLVMQGYYNNPAVTRQVIDAEGWLHTGDLATMDEKGYCRIIGRAKDLIIRGGENISPCEVEEFIGTCPGISEVQVFGVPDAKYGEEVAAWVKARQGIRLTEEEIRAFCVGKIAKYKIPRYIRLVDAFPMTVSGKVQKFKMREQFARELGLAGATGEKFLSDTQSA